tara:strand:- start:292 stop:675 length:384 start_codon:yes stop_codon:yes gene_type:complete
MSNIIPQAQFDQAVQKVLSLGLGRTPAENVVQSLWKASIDLNLDFNNLITQATIKGKLEVTQPVLDNINSNTNPDGITYNLKRPLNIPPIVLREFRVNNYDYAYTTQAGELITTQNPDEALLTEAGT